ncbi:glycosyltransferase family 2 protein [Candidatus Parcubacteria bacterium]|nr:glycosyltransferase family 2 protein [Candidatus Parcubacteria bacterium]
MKKETSNIPDISVVILCYRDGRSIEDFVSQMKSSLEENDLNFEIILVANYKPGVQDDTPRVAKSLSIHDPRLKIISKPKEGMYGWDVRAGLTLAQGKTVAYIDGDGQMPAEDVVRVYRELHNTGSDMALTYRTKRHDPLKRTFISKVYNILLRILFPQVKVFDANSKPKIFTLEALNKLDLKSDDWFIDPEIIIQATENKFKIAQIPTVFMKNSRRTSFVNAASILEFLKNLWNYRFLR